MADEQEITESDVQPVAEGHGVAQTEPGYVGEDEERVNELLAQAAELEQQNIDLGKEQAHDDTTGKRARELREERVKLNHQRSALIAEADAIRKVHGLSDAEREALRTALGGKKKGGRG